jgi:hypothetical protein
VTEVSEVPGFCPSSAVYSFSECPEIPPAVFTDTPHAAMMLFMVVRLAALVPVQEQMTPSG